MLIRVMLGAVVLCIVLVSGCEARLRDTRTVEVTAKDDLVLPYDARSLERSVTVTTRTQGGPINVYVYLSKHDPQIVENITAAAEDLFLARAMGVQDTELTVDVPADEEFMIVLSTVKGDPATVDLTVSE